jgi:hypothetical protein
MENIAENLFYGLFLLFFVQTDGKSECGVN